ncbi:hypothetical protein THRCLA_05814 [Thraustotheca clavata]|uniref:Uncharacterized protein n=1 Tax=Thraustotheca clavata TaxID=74557 RepID=A0A1V9ZSB3_9STRA|nr:hypothetical protein THRCLA_05814 [Thraustotheca clavata]
MALFSITSMLNAVQPEESSSSDESQGTPTKHPHGRKRQRDLQIVTNLASEVMNLESKLWDMKHAVDKKIQTATTWERSARLEAINRHTLEVQHRNLQQTVLAHCKMIHSLQSHLLKSSSLSTIPSKRPRIHYFNNEPRSKQLLEDSSSSSLTEEMPPVKPNCAVKLASLNNEVQQLHSTLFSLLQRLKQKVQQASPWELNARQETLDMHSAIVENRNLKAVLEEYMKYITALRFLVLKCPMAGD